MPGAEKKLWEREIQPAPGDVVFYLALNERRIVITSSNQNGYDVYGLEREDGRPAWHQRFDWPGGKGDHGKAMSRPALVGGKVYVRPRVLDEMSGELLDIQMPGGGCGTYAATRYALIFRQSNISMWNIDNQELSAWGRLRPGCWLSTIPAGGMLLSPEAGGGCSCGNWLEASIGFAPEQY